MCLQRLAEVAPAGSSAAVAAATEKRRLKQAQADYKQQMRKMSDNMSKQLFKGAKVTTSASSNPIGNVEVPGSEQEISVSTGKGGVKTDDTSGGGNNNNNNGEGKVGGKAVAAPPATAVPSKAAQVPTAATTTSTAAASADQGLLLLLLTSLAVLLVSVFLVVWTAKGK